MTRVDPMTATPDDEISGHQRNGIAELLGKLDRPYPPGGIGSLSFTGSGRPDRRVARRGSGAYGRD